VNPFFLNDFQQAAKNFPLARVTQVISILREYDLRSKGVDNGSATDGELMKEMVYRIIH
jgi:DNA polymerase-3 subunit delta